MAELQHWLPEDATFAPQINKTSTAMMHLRHSLESGVAGSEAGSPGKEGSVADSVRSSATSSVVDRLYAFHDKVSEWRPQWKLSVAVCCLWGVLCNLS
jgi:hypothetical protein